MCTASTPAARTYIRSHTLTPQTNTCTADGKLHTPRQLQRRRAKAAAILFIILLSLWLTLQFDSVTAQPTPTLLAYAPAMQLALLHTLCASSCGRKGKHCVVLGGSCKQRLGERVKCGSWQRVGGGKEGKLHELRNALQLPLARAAKRAEVVVQFPIFSLQHKAKKTHTHACKIMAGTYESASVCVCVCVCVRVCVVKAMQKL